MDLKSKLIGIISKQSSTVYGDKLIEFMDIYHLNNLRSATVEQLQEYINTYLKQEENTKN
ncbi:MAG: hypothetical protein MJ054_00160 [Clostridia bacterium]|nr:hypothetical protein [Clostridia bacterium]